MDERESGESGRECEREKERESERKVKERISYGALLLILGS